MVWSLRNLLAETASAAINQMFDGETGSAPCWNIAAIPSMASLSLLWGCVFRERYYSMRCPVRRRRRSYL